MVGFCCSEDFVGCEVSRVGQLVRSRVRRVPFPYGAPSVPRSVEAVPRRRNLGADFDTDWARRFGARFVRLALLEGALRPAMTALTKPERHGLDLIADLEGPAVFVANHHSHLDTPLMLTSLPEPFRHKVFVGAAADYFFRTRITSTASALVLNAIPIERSRVSRSSADQAAALIDEGWSMLIFPEGGRSKDGWGQPFRGGAAYLAQRCDVPIVPVHLEGTGRILRKGRKLPSPATARVTFGRPLRGIEGESSRALNERITLAVATLADEATTDWWQARRRAHDGTTPALSGPDAPAWRRAWALNDRRRSSSRRAKSWPRV